MYLTMQYQSKALMRALTLHILLPNDGVSGVMVEQPYKTLYFLNGFGSSATELLTYLPFRRQCEIKKIAVVMPDGNNSFYVDHPKRLSNYATFISKELVEVTRSILPLSHKKEDTFLGGISMGGYAALRLGILNNNTFGKIVTMSPAVDPFRIVEEMPEAGFTKEMMDNLFESKETFRTSDLSPTWLIRNTPKEQLPEMFLCIGKEDFLVGQQCLVFIEEAKLAKASMETLVAPGGHEIDFWETMMDPAFSFLAGIPAGSKNRILMG